MFLQIKKMLASAMHCGFPVALTALLLGLPALSFAQESGAGGGEANLILPDLSTASFLGINGKVF